MSSDLKESCKQILQRLQQQDVEEFSCLLCGQRVRGQDALMQHLITEHEVHCVHFDNVADLPRLLEHLGALLHPAGQPSLSSSSTWACPVCGEDTASVDVTVLQRHLREAGHQHWMPQTIPSIAPWCVSATAAPSSAPPASAAAPAAKSDADSEWDDMDDEEVDDEDDWNMECVCLYCDYSGEDVLEHFKTSHGFDFRAAVQRRPDVKSEYDLIRAVNMVRRAVCSDRCPYGEACDVDGKQNDRAALEAHLATHKEHRLPQRVSTSDSDLIPVLPGDAFISMLVTSGEGFLQAEEEDPDFPMVPTVQELAAAASRQR